MFYSDLISTSEISMESFEISETLISDPVFKFLGINELLLHINKKLKPFGIGYLLLSTWLGKFKHFILLLPEVIIMLQSIYVENK